jgi:PAS domain S-box-containing protein
MTTPPSPATDAPWARIVADVADALVYADAGGAIRAWNGGAEALFGFSAAEALGQSLDLIIPERLRAPHWAAYDRAMASGLTRLGAQVRTTRATHRDASRKLYVDMSFGVVRGEDGAALGSVAMARDATERYLAEQARRAAASAPPRD